MIARAGGLLDLLTARGLLDEADRDRCVAEANGDELNQAIGRGMVDGPTATAAIAEALGLQSIDLRETDIDPAALKAFPVRLIYRHRLMPIRWDDDQLIVATADPLDPYPIDEASAELGCVVVPVIAEPAEIDRVIKRHLGVGGQTVDGLVAAAEPEEIELLESIETDGSEQSEAAQEASVVRLVNEILIEAVDSKASDVHIESQEAGLVVRYRIDGILHPQPTPPEINRFAAAIVSRLKIMAHLNIAEKRLPQDGRIKLRVHRRDVDVRLSVIPMIHGEGLVMRILDKSSMKFDLRGLGMSQPIFERFSELIELPHGIILVTGPTGSGKTTTLYSALLQIRSDSNKIITTEDPVEYQLEGINQIQVHSKIGLTFAASLRSILRHDPDVVLVGEIRDLETAENATQASLTGHLVFSTLHTNDAAGAFTRMADMGVEPFLVAGTVEGVLAQRLVRRLCPHCKRAVTPKAELMASDFPWDSIGDNPIYEPVGCRICRNVGYAGRQGIYELLIADDKVRELAGHKASSRAIRAAGVEGGMRTLRMDAWDKVVAGITSIEEVMRVTRIDG